MVLSNVFEIFENILAILVALVAILGPLITAIYFLIRLKINPIINHLEELKNDSRTLKDKVAGLDKNLAVMKSNGKHRAEQLKKNKKSLTRILTEVATSKRKLGQHGFLITELHKNALSIQNDENKKLFVLLSALLLDSSTGAAFYREPLVNDLLNTINASDLSTDSREILDFFISRNNS